MPEGTISGTDMHTALDTLEKSTLPTKTRLHNYSILQYALEQDIHFEAEDINRLLATCVLDTPSMKYTATVANIIPLILSKLKVGSYSPSPDLLPSILSVIKILKTIALLGKAESLLTLWLETLFSYPEDILIRVTEVHNEDIIEVFDLCCHTRVPIEIRFQACQLLYKLVKALPQEVKKQFIINGVTVWFSKIIPIVMKYMTDVIINVDCPTEPDTYLQLIEMLTDDLVNVDYTCNSAWYSILESICVAKQYPAIMKNLLAQGSKDWHRLWIVMIRLLKHQITESLSSIGTPINSMLPVVEAAFKLDVTNRCKAFECWNVLIDNFATETNESNINKRIKLLIIPLKSNNAKTEETAIAKLKCWWHLIIKFQNRMDKFLDIVFVSFLHFCFGRHNAADKTAIVPGQLSSAVKKYCNEALVDMVGHHVNCDNCIHLPKLNGKIINTKHLVDNWNHWIYSISSVIMRMAKNDLGLTKQQLKCLWTSFLKTIGELPENNIRKDLFIEIISIVARLVQECKFNTNFLDTVFEILILSLFEEDTKIKHLHKSYNSPSDPIPRIFKIVMDPALQIVYKSIPHQDLIIKFRTITNFILDTPACNPKQTVNNMLDELPAHDKGLLFWSALTESIYESKYDINLLDTCKVILWPLKSLHLFTEVQIPAITWHKTYDLLKPKTNKSETHKEITKILFTSTDETVVPQNIAYFKLCIVLALLKDYFTENDCLACEKEINVLFTLTKRMNSYKYFESLMPLLVDRIVAIMCIVTSNVNDTITPLILVAAKNVLHVLTQACKQQSESEKTVTHLMLLVANLLKPMEILFTIEAYSKLIPAMAYHLIRCTPLLSTNSVTSSTLVAVMKAITTKIKDTDTNNKIKKIICDIENVKGTSTDLISKSNNEFPAPNPKEVPKRTKKKEASIVNTVVENGEEYVVVKSNWKFNPRKLTENQKEKLQRKREDIPALYQDLSQSQEEFKLQTWKADSQDTTSSSKSESKSSKPESTESAVDILKNLPSTDVVPKILETMFADKVSEHKDLTTKETVNKIEVSSPASKNIKSPRIALKDRIFRNMKNLIESSGLQKETQNSNNKTPESIKNVMSIAPNSAPTLISADRPSRVKRKPKKFDDLELLPLKKRRNSVPDLEASNTEVPSNISITTAEDIIEVKSSQNDYVIEPSAREDAVSVKDQNICSENNIKINNSNSIQNPDTNTVSTSDLNDDGRKLIIVADENVIESSANVKQLSTPKSTNHKPTTVTSNCKEISPSPVDGKEVSTPRSSKIGKNNSHFNACKLFTQTPEAEPSHVNSSVNQGTLSKVIDADKEVAVTTNKMNDVSPPEMTNDIELVTTLKTSENCDDVVAPTIPDEVIELSTSDASGDFQEIATSPPVKEITENHIELSNTDGSQDFVVSTPKKPKETKNMSTPKSSLKMDDAKSGKKRKSRIETELAIDTVEGHPFLKTQQGKRLTRKASESLTVGRRKSLVQKLNKTKSEGGTPKIDKKTKEKAKGMENTLTTSVIVDESHRENCDQKEQTSFSDDLPDSDVIESSQDSTMTTISIKSTRKTPIKVPTIYLEKITTLTTVVGIHNSQSILDRIKYNPSTSGNNESKDDSVLPLNKTVLEPCSPGDLTENMDTQPLNEQNFSDEVVLVSNSENIIIGLESQEIAEADTQPTDPKQLIDTDNFCETSEIAAEIHAESHIPETCSEEIDPISVEQDRIVMDKANRNNTEITLDNTTVTLSESACGDTQTASGTCSPFKDEAQRQQDFLNNTVEISPIKTMSPSREKSSPTSDPDYVVIKLTSPVTSNGEPFERGSSSPEVFTEEKTSPDKRDQSPPREETTVAVTSPSASLSLKKNRPQVRSGGRAAQMLGLCIPDKVQAIVNPERHEPEEVKKTSTTTPVRRNLRILYNSVGESTELNPSTNENDETESFLKFKRTVPSVDCSPSVPILKRKLAEISDDATVSPVSKRKRVSFHDPPVSTTISVQKYIEPGGLRSPQSSAQKRVERQMRQYIVHKSQKRLDTAFKLDTVLTKAVESFSDNDVVEIPEDSQALSLDVTPVAEVVRTSELNNTDPICPDLLDCQDSIEHIAGDLSSPAMKSLLIKELEGTIETVGDLAKLTELEVNRLCIKAPKVEVAKKVLTDYVAKRSEYMTIEAAEFAESMTEPERRFHNFEMQTDSIQSIDMDMQTEEISSRASSSQTEVLLTAHLGVQTNDSGSNSSTDVIISCLSEKPDFVEALSECLGEQFIKQICEKLPLHTVTDLLTKKITPSDTEVVLNRILENENDKSKELSFFRDYLCGKFDTKDLILLCSQVLNIIHDKPA